MKNEAHQALMDSAAEEAYCSRYVRGMKKTTAKCSWFRSFRGKRLKCSCQSEFVCHAHCERIRRQNSARPSAKDTNKPHRLREWDFRRAWKGKGLSTIARWFSERSSSSTPSHVLR